MHWRAGIAEMANHNSNLKSNINTYIYVDMGMGEPKDVGLEIRTMSGGILPTCHYSVTELYDLWHANNGL